MSADLRNVIIIGSGPAALTAGLYTARANLAPLVFTGVKWGGQLMLTTDVENYPGFPEGILGPELMEKFREQAARFGAEIVAQDVTAVDFTRTSLEASHGQEVKPFKVIVGNKAYAAKSVIIATGAETKWLGLANEQRLIGKGVSSCAPCDAFFFKDKKVIVVGGGDAAMREAQHLSKFAQKVTIVHRRDNLKAQPALQQLIKSKPNVDFLWNKTVEEVLGQEKVSGVKLKDTQTGEISQIDIDGVFIAIGHKPNTDFLKGQLDLDEVGYIKVTDEVFSSVKGVFVAGDVGDFRYRQAATAAGAGTKAALEAEHFLETNL